MRESFDSRTSLNNYLVLLQFFYLLGGSVLGIDGEDLVSVFLGQGLVLAIDECVGHHVVVAVLQHGVLAVVAISLAFEQVNHLLIVWLCEALFGSHGDMYLGIRHLYPDASVAIMHRFRIMET